MSNPSFPDWAPSAAIEALHVTGAETEQQDPHGAAMVRLLTREGDARPGWEAVKKKSERLGRDVDYDVKMIALRCVIAFGGPATSTERMAPTARERWKQDVANKARELADLMRGSALDEILVLDLDRFHQLSIRDPHGFGTKYWRKGPNEIVQLGIGSDPCPVQNLPDYLEYVAENVGSVVDGHDLVMGAPNAPLARRAYFMRSLTAELMKLYNDREPMRPVVIAFVRAAFDDPSFEPSQLSRLVPVTD